MRTNDKSLNRLFHGIFHTDIPDDILRGLSEGYARVTIIVRLGVYTIYRERMSESSPEEGR